MRFHAGNMLCSDIFYHADGIAGYDKLPEHGVLGVEMEAAALYTLAARFGVKALAICTMTDCLITKEEIDAEQRQTSLKDMVSAGAGSGDRGLGVPLSMESPDLIPSPQGGGSQSGGNQKSSQLEKPPCPFSTSLPAPSAGATRGPMWRWPKRWRRAGTRRRSM